MSRSYKKVRPMRHRVYSVPQVKDLYDVCRTTVSNWVRDGLCPSPGEGPQLFRGEELSRFHEVRRSRSHQSLRHGQFKCFTCKAIVFPHVGSLEFLADAMARPKVFAACPDCGARTSKLLSETECDKLQKAAQNNTSLKAIDEDVLGSQAGVGKICTKRDENTVGAVCSCNDRVVFEWQQYAGRYDDKTIAAHLVSIREFEASVGGKPFEMLLQRDVAAYREDLLLRLDENGDQALSVSTVRHRASHVRAFLDWLRSQNGFRRLGSNLPGYLELPRRLSAKALPKVRDYPDIKAAAEMIDGMRSVSLREKRDQAIVDMAFLSGFRATALINLRLKHVYIEEGTVIHDGRSLKGKNGKNFVASFFPRTEYFEGVVCTWIKLIKNLGLGSNDALFPDYRRLCHKLSSHQNIQPMTSTGAVTRAFRSASVVAGASYSPHCARDTLAALGASVCKSARERKAWSLNLGHETDVITERYYGKMSEDCRAEIITEIRERRDLIDDEKDLLLDLFFSRLQRGSPEYARAKGLQISLLRAEDEVNDVIEA
ncbi:hypothetical protein [Vannielia litorea]|uniref:hypothetical protein n=1 Tax=Vannielia litorea TaxID=1217970 RepID=UPI001C954556|nr:hypothetical protein [Vannielia litorea]MBY6047889.1 hypothetical protein [Vannielia litorea]MBY6075303.1 hypothetical protein [Vannielia litorea]